MTTNRSLHLNDRHALFGTVVAGWDVVKLIVVWFTMVLLVLFSFSDQ
jgi:hypothetical protein